MAILISMAAGGGRNRRGTLFRQSWNWVAQRRVLGVWLLLLSWGGPGMSGLCAGIVSHEYPLKAIFLLNFARFTDWPADTLTDSKSPFVIGVLGADPFGDALDDAVRDERWNTHPITVQRFARVQDLQTCQVLFISESEVRHLPKIVAALKGKAILTVTDVNGGSSDGVMVQFVTENNKIHFKINVDSLRNASLMMSSKLLRLAEIVPAQNK